jgi:hypothetical protein
VRCWHGAPLRRYAYMYAGGQVGVTDGVGSERSGLPRMLQQGNLVALGTKEGGGASFDDYGGELEIHKLDFQKGEQKTKLQGTVRSSSRFVSLAWSALATKRADFPLGLVAGGMMDGAVGVWDPSKLSANHPQPRIALIQKHQGSVSGLQFNPHPESSHLLASGGADGEVRHEGGDGPLLARRVAAAVSDAKQTLHRCWSSTSTGMRPLPFSSRGPAPMRQSTRRRSRGA